MGVNAMFIERMLEVSETEIAECIVNDIAEMWKVDEDAVRHLFKKITAAELMDFFLQRGQWSPRSEKRRLAALERWGEILADKGGQ